MIWNQFLSFGALYSQWNLSGPGIRVTHGCVSLPHLGIGYADHQRKDRVLVKLFFFCGFISRKSLNWKRINLHETGIFLVSLKNMKTMRTSVPQFCEWHRPFLQLCRWEDSEPPLIPPHIQVIIKMSPHKSLEIMFYSVCIAVTLVQANSLSPLVCWTNLSGPLLISPIHCS